MVHKTINSEISDFFTADFDRMAKSQGIYSMTKGFNHADTLTYYQLLS